MASPEFIYLDKNKKKNSIKTKNHVLCVDDVKFVYSLNS